LQNSIDIQEISKCLY